MKNKMIISAMIAGCLLLNIQVIQAASFYKCTSGYSFKINNAKTGARCEKRTGAMVKPISCPSFLGMGTFQHTRSGKDRCAGRGAFSIEASHDPLACPSGFSYQKNYNGNKDRCVKAGKLTIKAPTKKFR